MRDWLIELCHQPITWRLSSLCYRLMAACTVLLTGAGTLLHATSAVSRSFGPMAKMPVPPLAQLYPALPTELMAESSFGYVVTVLVFCLFAFLSWEAAREAKRLDRQLRWL